MSGNQARGGGKSLAVVVPAYNEGRGVEECVRRVSEVLAGMDQPTGLIVVDDGSVDDTGQVLRDLVASVEKLTVVTHQFNRGYGAALRTGVQTAAAAGFEYVLFMDSDLTNDPGYIPAFVERMGEGVDVIKASRYIPGGGREGVPWWRVAVSVVGNAAARRLFGLPIHDCTNGFRAVRTSLLASIALEENGFAVIMEELYRLRPLGLTYAEVPVVLTNRSGNLRPSSFSYDLRTLGRYLKYPVLSAFHSVVSARRQGARA